MKFTTTLLLALCLQFALAQNPAKNVQPSDVAVHHPVPYDYKKNKNYEKVEATTRYLTMRDDTKIAVTVYLPKGLEPGKKIPAIIYQTRYWRAANLRWPVSMFSDGLLGNTGKTIKEIILNGYALVAVDSRGSGASMGVRPHPWTDDETKDGAEIVDWTISQDWCSGKIGTAGISYSGTTAEFLLVNQHPNVKAALIMYSLFDVYDDNAFPGGVHHQHFTKTWGEANYALDNNKLPVKNILVKLLVKGVQPVKGEKKEMKTAKQLHQQNLNVHDGALAIDFRDDLAPNAGVSSAKFSPYSYLDQINNSGAAVYSISGWLDGPYPHAAIRRFLNLSLPHNKLMLGPWNHGGDLNISPFNPSESGFDHASEFLKFFDFHLKGIQNSIDQEPAIHYFTMGEEKWNTSNTWPPENPTEKRLYLNTNNQLTTAAPTIATSFDQYQVNNQLGSGEDSRFRSLLGDLDTPNAYPDRKERGAQLLNYNSAPLTADTKITGHPIISLQIKSTASDGHFIAYLEDVHPDGHVSYVTEGQLRAVHRKLSEDTPIYKDAVPYISYLRKDGEPLIPGQIHQIQFDLLPTSYLFKKGHSIRISIASADKDHFEQIAPDGTKIEVHHSQAAASYISLPTY